MIYAIFAKIFYSIAFIFVIVLCFRGATDIAKRLDDQKGCALTITDIFTPSGEVLRAKLKDYCERLIFKDPVGHARKTEELLWRKGFYDAVFTAKKLRKVWIIKKKCIQYVRLYVEKVEFSFARRLFFLKRC